MPKIENFPIEGAGGKSGAARQAVEADNTLRTQTLVNVLEVISEGQIVGLENGWKDVYLNQIPVENEDGTRNFEEVAGEFRVGLPSQTVIPGFEEISAVFPSNTLVSNSDGSPAEELAGSVTHIILGTGVTSASITLQLNQGLSKLDEDSGNLNGYKVSYKIYTKQLTPAVGTEIEQSFTISGKTVTTYQADQRIEAPTGSDTWQFRVARVDIDDQSAKERSEFSLVRWTEIQQPIPSLTYPDTALAGITVPAEEVGNQVPTRGYLVKGIICQVPSNYNAATKVYTGAWNGSFVSAWTDNPAWVLYDVITNTRYGIGEFLGQSITTDKWSFYDAGVYCDGRVPSGFGDDTDGGEARFTFNAVIQKQSNAWQLLQAMASVMRAVVVVDGGNKLALIQDRPTDTSKIITNSNVLAGIFTYSSTAIDERPTSCNVTFNDKEDRYLPRTISEPDEQDDAAIAFIDKYGFNQIDLVAYATVTESQARRLARWVLYSSHYEYDNVAFSLALNVAGLEVGDVIGIMDNDYITADNTTFLGGRVLSEAGTTITLDYPVNLSETGYTFSVMSSDYLALVERTITNSGTTDTLTLDSALPVGDYELHDFYCFKTGVIEPRLYKVLSISENEDKQYLVTCSFYDPQKWDVVELEMALKPYNYNIQKPLDKVTGLSVIEDDRNDDVLATSLMRLVWDYNPKHLSYKVKLTFNDGTPFFRETSELFLEFENIPVGSYYIEIVAIGLSRTSSPAASLLYNYGVIASTLLPPINLEVTGGGLIFNDTRISLSWDYNPANDDVVNELNDYVASLLTFDGLTLLKEYIIPYEIDTAAVNYKGATVVYSKEAILNDFGNLPREFQIKVHSRDLLGRKSPTSIAINVTNEAPPAPLGTIEIYERDVIVTLAGASVIPDLANLIVAISVDSGFTPEDRELWLDKVEGKRAVKGIKYPGVQLGTLYARFALDDTYSDQDLNWSPQLTLDIDGSQVFVTPTTPEGLAISIANVFSPEGDVTITADITWTAITVPVTGYTVKVAVAGVDRFFESIEPSLRITGLIPDGLTYPVSVRANYGTSFSPYSATENITLDYDIVPTAPPSNLTFEIAVGTATVKWTNPIDDDFKYTELWVASTNDRSTATLNTQTPNDYFTYAEVNQSVTYYFWLRSFDKLTNPSTWYPVSPTGGIEATSIASFDYTVPGVPPGLTLTENVIQDANGVTALTATVEWGVVSAPVTSYTIKTQRTDVAVDPRYIEVPDLSHVFTGLLVGMTFDVQVKANNVTASGTYSAIQSISILGDVTAPSAPSGFLYSDSIDTITLSWTNPTDDDFKHTEIWTSLTNDRATATLSRVTSGHTELYSDFVDGTSYYVWARSFDNSGNDSVWSSADLAGFTVTPNSTGIDYADVTGTKPPTDATKGSPSGTLVDTMLAQDVDANIVDLIARVVALEAFH